MDGAARQTDRNRHDRNGVAANQSENDCQHGMGVRAGIMLFFVSWRHVVPRHVATWRRQDVALHDAVQVRHRWRTESSGRCGSSGPPGCMTSEAFAA
jgi:hypothetical protein